MIEVRNICLQAHPRLMSLVPNSDVEPGSTVVVYAPEIEAEVEAIYRKLYAGALTVESLLTVLDAAKASENPRDHEIFAGVLHTVFDEYKFYPEYPPRELAITAQLFGSLIQNRLVENVPLGIAIRYVLTAIGDPKLFSFGVQALSRFIPRLVEFPAVCHELLSMQSFVDAQPDMAEQIKKALRFAESGVLGESGQLIFTSISPDDITEGIVEPSEEASDKMLFIVNNLAMSNFEPKTAEMKQYYTDDVAAWFAKYLVEERVSTEPNNHGLYSQFLDALAKPKLHKLILHETYVKSARLLNDENTLQSSTDKVVLKHLGSWLGRLTLARDRPVKFRNLSIKDLLLEGYDQQRLVIVIPFVCKILEATKNSTVFKAPYNPWLMPILGLLVELYFQADLKLNQKFEIEVLFKDLELLMDEIQATSLLNSRPNHLAGVEINEPVAGPEAADANYASEGVPGMPGGLSMMEDPEVMMHLENLLVEMRSRIYFDPELEPWAAVTQFVRMVQNVFEQVTRETCVSSFPVQCYKEMRLIRIVACPASRGEVRKCRRHVVRQHCFEGLYGRKRRRKVEASRSCYGSETRIRSRPCNCKGGLTANVDQYFPPRIVRSTVGSGKRCD